MDKPQSHANCLLYLDTVVAHIHLIFGATSYVNGTLLGAVQRLAIVGALGLVNFITAVVYHFCPSLSAAFTKPGALTSADLCIIY